MRKSAYSHEQLDRFESQITEESINEVLQPDFDPVTAPSDSETRAAFSVRVLRNESAWPSVRFRAARILGETTLSAAGAFIKTNLNQENWK